MYSDRARALDPAVADSAPIGIAIIGGGWFFTSQTCNHVEMEFRVRCAQANSVEHLGGAREYLDDLRLLVVDQALAGDLLERPDAYRELNPRASLAIGYRDAAKARAFLRHYSEDQHGPIGFLPMNAPLEVLLSSMRMLVHREFFLPRSLLGDAMHLGDDEDVLSSDQARRVESEAKLSRLTRREREVLKLVSEGDSNKEIASRLGITEHTVKLHIHNLSGKFGVSNRTAAANLYFAARNDGHDVA